MGKPYDDSVVCSLGLSLEHSVGVRSGHGKGSIVQRRCGTRVLWRDCHWRVANLAGWLNAMGSRRPLASIGSAIPCR